MTRPLDPPVGTVKYGDFTFPSPVNVKVQVRPEYDGSGRVVKWRTYHIQIEVILVGNDFPGAGSIPAISAGEALDKSGTDPMRILRRQLTTPGLPLQIVAQGLGQDLSFTTANVVGYGPKPSVLAWEPIGSAQACRVIWTCEVSAVECGTAVLGLHTGTFGELSYTIDFGIAEDGLSTRSVSGLIEVDCLRMGSFRISRTADQFRHFITRNIPPLVNFSRTQNYGLSENRRFIRFNIVDKEHESENPLYPHVVRADVEQRISARWPAKSWNFSFSGTILVAPGQPREIAWAAFVAAIRPRLRIFHRMQQAKDNDMTLIPRQIDISEKILGGREMSFNLTFATTTSIESIFKSSGLWTPVPGNWSTWQTKMLVRGGPHDPRGSAQLQHTYMEDRIFSFCVNVPVPPTPSRVPSRRSPGEPDFMQVFAYPEENKSWYQYELTLTILKGNQTIVSRRIGDSDGEAAVDLSVSDTEIQVTPRGYNPTTGDLVIQPRGPSDYRVVLEGIARRAHHPIKPGDVVVIKTIDGERATAIEDTVVWAPRKDPKRSTIDPMYMVEWKYTYALPSPKSKIVLGEYPKTKERLE